MRTYSPKASEIERAWYVVDAEGLDPGPHGHRGRPRPARQAQADVHSQHLDTGDHVIIVNADKVVLTSDKAETKQVYRHTGYPGGIRSSTYAEMLDRKPGEAVRRTIRGMLPKNRLGRQMLTKLKVYAGPDHPHAARSRRCSTSTTPEPARNGDQTIMPTPLVQSTGRRKRAVARVRIREGAGAITINKRPRRGLLPEPDAPDDPRRAAAPVRDRRGRTTSTPPSTAAA